MNAALAHRGPDGQGLLLAPPVGLAMRRLSIIDLQTGDQPIANEDGSIHVVYNGELYNHPQLRAQLTSLGHTFRTRADTETIVHAYEQWGEDFLQRLNGMFAFALWDARTHTLLAARDRTGIKPLYYARTPGALIFGSELKALLAHPALGRELDLRALSFYLSLEYVPSPLTILRGVRKLPPGHFLRARADQVDEVRYWDFRLTPSEAGRPNAPVAAQARAFRQVLHQAVAGEMLSDVPVGVLLSGGLDSSAIAALMVEHAGGPVPSFSIGFPERSFDETRFARLVARHLGADHHELILTSAMMLDLVPTLAAHLDEPFADPSIIPTYLVSRFARDHVKVVLGGDGGDEMLAGYSTLQAHRAAPAYRALPGWLRHRVVEPVIARMPAASSYLALDFKLKRFVRGTDEPAALQHQMWTGSFYGADKAAILAPDVAAELGDDGLATFVAAIAAASGARHPLNRVLYQDMQLYLDGDILPKVDRASMAVSLETRVPFLNLDVLNFLARTPLELKLRGFTRKYLLRRAMAASLPPAIIGRRKQGFSVPIARWLRAGLRDMAWNYLNPQRIGREGLFNPAAVHDLWSAHQAGRANHAKLLWTLLMFQQWRARWLDAPAPYAWPA